MLPGRNGLYFEGTTAQRYHFLAPGAPPFAVFERWDSTAASILSLWVCLSQTTKSPAGQTGLGKMPVGTLPFKQLHYSKPKQVEKPCGGRRTRTVMADLATRLLERQRPVPTGNVLQTQPLRHQYLRRFGPLQSHESSHSKRRIRR